MKARKKLLAQFYDLFSRRAHNFLYHRHKLENAKFLMSSFNPRITLKTEQMRITNEHAAQIQILSIFQHGHILLKANNNE